MDAPIELKRYHTQRGSKAALVKVVGPKWMQVLIMTAPLTVRKVSTMEQNFMTDMNRRGVPYPIKTAVRHFRRFGKTSGMKPAARKFLSEACK